MRKRPILALLILATVIWTLLGVASALAALFVPMLFDTEGSTSHPPTLALAASVVLCPLACITSIVGSWLAFRRERHRNALWFSALPLLPIAIAALAAFANEVIYAGRLGG